MGSRSRSNLKVKVKIFFLICRYTLSRLSLSSQVMGSRSRSNLKVKVKFENYFFQNIYLQAGGGPSTEGFATCLILVLRCMNVLFYITRLQCISIY